MCEKQILFRCINALRLLSNNPQQNLINQQFKCGSREIVETP